VAGKDGDGYPLGRTYVLKAGPEVTNPFSTGPSSTPGPTAGEEQVIEECLRETLELCTREVQGSVPVQSPVDPEEENSFPIPEDTSSPDVPTGSPDWSTPEAMSMKLIGV
jgi:hypothetical protein